ncbi:MAG: sigma-70 family RNA polymerase sigma factor [Myxococcota bacterium]
MDSGTEAFVRAALAGRADRQVTASVAEDFGRARTRWSQLDVEPEAFGQFVASKWPPAGPGAGLLLLEDLLLAFACGHGVPGAIEAFEGAFGSELRRGLPRHDEGVASADDLRQLLRTKLFTGAAPKILDYGGRGPLRLWVAVTARRVYIDGGKTDRRRADKCSDVDPARLEGLHEDPELQFLKERYRTHFREAFVAGLTGLSARARNVLRLCLVERVGQGRVATMYGVHRMTVNRWLSRARADLLEQTRTELARRLGPDAGELDSVMALVASRLELTLSRLLPRDLGDEP